MENKVKELAAKLVEVIDKKEGWENAEQKLGYIKAYLLGLQDGFDYCVEHVSSMTSVKIESPAPTHKIKDLLYTCTQCGGKTTSPVFFPDQFMVSRRAYCAKCAFKKLNE
jgi:hypothetical protein